jgi:hypothetical protein
VDDVKKFMSRLAEDYKDDGGKFSMKSVFFEKDTEMMQVLRLEFGAENDTNPCLNVKSPK